MEKHKVRAVVLILASNEILYQQARYIWKKYMYLDPQIKVFFVYGKLLNSLVDQDENDLIFNDLQENYQNMIELTRVLSKKYKYINNVRNSHDVVCYLMILMNYNVAKNLITHKNGIFRYTIMKREVSIPESLPEDVAKFNERNTP